MVTGFPPGGTSDTCARRVADGLRGRYARTTVVENRTGAGGQIAVQAMKGAPTDGSVILQTPASMLMIYPHIYKKLAYDAFTDVTAVTLACTFDFGFCVGPAVPDSVKTRSSWRGARPIRTRPTTARRRPARCRTSSACCWARRAASS